MLDRDRKWQYDGFLQTAYEAITELNDRLKHIEELVYKHECRLRRIEDALRDQSYFPFV
jgi:DNA-directed RNA polymerase specialized sigma subunit